MFTTFYNVWSTDNCNIWKQEDRKRKILKICWLYFYSNSHSVNILNKRSGFKLKLHFYTGWIKKARTHSGHWECLQLMEMFSTEIVYQGRTLLNDMNLLFLGDSVILCWDAIVPKSPLNSPHRAQWTPEQGLEPSGTEADSPKKLDAALPFS